MPEEASRERNSQDDHAVLIPPEVQTLFDRGEIATGRMIPEGKQAQTRDFVNALAISDAGEAMIFEEGASTGGVMSWHVVGGHIEDGEDPMSAIQRALLEVAGYSSDEWLYLGSYMAEADQDMGVGHFFCARDARPACQPVSVIHQEMKIRWVSQQDLRYALLDGRISVLSYAITISMALLTVLD
jgi:ADP-ribose pyrophosphatase YjhB (NUDIX family)